MFKGREQSTAYSCTLFRGGVYTSVTDPNKLRSRRFGDADIHS
jgi:hypothetical protein